MDTEARNGYPAFLVDRGRLLLCSACLVCSASAPDAISRGGGFSSGVAAWGLGTVSVAGIPGQIVFGALSDRIGREWVWTIGCAGFAICYVALIGLEHSPSSALLFVMLVSQGFMGY